MSDILGYRRKIGLMIDAANSIVAADCARMGLTGITLHASDIDIGGDRQAGINASAARLAQKNVHAACLMIDDFFTAPQPVNMAPLQEILGVAVADPLDSLAAAIEATGFPRGVGLVSPFDRLALEAAKARLASLGIEVVGHAALPAGDIATQGGTTFIALRNAVAALSGDAQAILQLGHNLPFTILVENIEEDQDLPVLAINQVCLWHSLRSSGIDDIVPGYGRLFIDF